MQTNKILSAPLVDLIFDGRNKEYGAYELRVHYQKRIKRAMLTTFTIAAMAIGGTVLAGSMKKKEIVYRIVPGVELASIPDETIPEPPPKEEIPPVEDPPKTEKFIDNIVIVDKAVITDPPPDQDALKNADIGAVKIDGHIADNIARPEVISKGVETGIIDKPEKKNLKF